MRTSSAGVARRRTVEFATIDEEPEISSSSVDLLRSGSSISITVDDLDPQALARNRSSLDGEYDATVASAAVRHRDDRRSSTTHDSRRPSPAISNSRLPSSASSQAGLFSVLRRLGGSYDASAVDRGGGRGGGRPSATPPPNLYAMNAAGGNSDGAARHERRGAVYNNGAAREQRRATLFNRQRRSTTASYGSGRASDGDCDGGGGNGHDDDDDDAGEEAAVRNSCVSDARAHSLRRIIDDRRWTGTTFLFVVVLLFLPPVQDIWLPKSADGFVDGMLTLGFVVLAFDIVARCLADESYFACNRNEGGGKRRRKALRVCCVGSFMFYFDAVALLTIWYRLSYANPAMRRPEFVTVSLNELGFPREGSRHATPLSVDWPLMLTIGRVGLMARFIRTEALVELTSNWGWLLYFVPRYWMSRCGGRRGNGGEPPATAASCTAATATEGGSNGGPGSSVGRAGLDRHSGRFSETDGIPDPPDEPESPPPDERRGRSFFRSLGPKRSDSAAGSSDGALPWSRADGAFGGGGGESRSHVGAAMQELTGQRIATGALMALLMTILCDWHENDTTKVMTMLALHSQTADVAFANRSLDVARSSVIPTLFNYTRSYGTNGSVIFSNTYGDWSDLREREILNVDVYQKGVGVYTSGWFDNSQSVIDDGTVELVTTILILFIWILGVASFAGPVMTLVVEPIERMVRLLSMLMKDPLGYQSTPQYQELDHEREETADKYRSIWPKEVLKGMETNFLMSTILRIGSLMQVGFGSAGVEIIRNHLERGRHKDVLFLSKQGASISCIFLFCDIRQFTDVTECLQEEVFVFTNKVAAVVHSICHSYGGSANKNIGDAFLLSWRLDDPSEKEEEDDDPLGLSSSNFNLGKPYLYAKNNQADAALLSVVKISMALHYDNFYVDGMNETARDRLLTKMSKRKGPLVQIGFGLHAGNAVQGAIGSQRKLDATYISESVERSEFLESSTKKYGVPILMSEDFYNLLDSSNRNRCRKVDQLIIPQEGQDGGDLSPYELLDTGEKMNIYTFDMDIDALWRPPADEGVNTSATNNVLNVSHRRRSGNGNSMSNNVLNVSHRRRSATTHSMSESNLGRRGSFGSSFAFGGNDTGQRLSSLFAPNKDAAKPDVEKVTQVVAEGIAEKKHLSMNETLELPKGVCHYSEKAWRDPQIKIIRRGYVSNGIIFPKYEEGLKSYFAKDWDNAKQCFEFVLSQRDDGPSRCFLRRIAEHGGVPPRDFIGYTRSDEL